jgi:pimeloyl-ACP methyl ester carboxylesterase
MLGAPSSARVQARCTSIDGLAVAVLSAEGGRRAADPLFFIPGGPGQSGLAAFAQVAGAFELVRRHRDIVVVDPRGTGASEPLTCGTEVPDDLRSKGALEQLRACAAELGDKPRRINTANAVRDLDNVRRALGYDTIDVYAASYGTRVAQDLARSSPMVVRAMILDGVLAPESSIGGDQAVSAERALDAVWRRCQETADCAERYGDVRATALRLSGRLGQGEIGWHVDIRNPTSGDAQVIHLDRRLFEDTVRNALYQSELVALLPKLLYDADHGDVGGLARLAALLRDSLDEAVNPLVYLSVVCAEDVPFLRPSESGVLFRARFPELAEACKAWPVTPADAAMKTPVDTDVPMLLISGASDPVTPPSEADKVAAHAKRARKVVLADHGHIGVVRGCVPRLVADFLDAPEMLDVSCAARTAVLPLFNGANGP